MHFALELAAQHGTPFYVYDLTVLRHRVRHARAAMPAKVLFAVKANPNPELLRALHGEVDGLDVASRGELETALACGFAGETLSFTGPAKSDDALAFAVEHDVLINVESMRELTQRWVTEHGLRSIAHMSDFEIATILRTQSADFYNEILTYVSSIDVGNPEIIRSLMRTALVQPQVVRDSMRNNPAPQRVLSKAEQDMMERTVELSTQNVKAPRGSGNKKRA